MFRSYRAPVVPNSLVTPQFVRDELLRCFESANREFAGVLRMQVTDDVLRAQVKGFVTQVFGQCGVDYVNPTKEGIEQAIEQCKSNAEKMMGTQGADIIKHHYAEMMKLVARLP